MTTSDNFRSATFELRNTGDGDAMPTYEITFARFGVWNEIHSMRGRFLERIEPGAFADTFAERGDIIKCLFNHGHDPSIGDKPIGTVSNLRETELGPAGDVALFDTNYVRELLPGLEAGVYGASYRFGTEEETVVERPERSEHNPDGIPERTLTRLRVSEFGPVCFPADAGTHGQLVARSLEQRFGAPKIEATEDEPAGALDTAARNRADTATAFAIARRSRT